MTITNTWSIKQLDCKAQIGSLTDYVVTAHWVVNGTDGVYNGVAYGATNFIENADKTDYTPFSELTSDEVVDWVKTTLGDEKLAKIETSIAVQINDQANPPIVTPDLPWSA